MVSDELDPCASSSPGTCVYLILGFRRRGDALEPSELTLTHERELAYAFFQDDIGQVDVTALFCAKSVDASDQLILIKSTSPLPSAWLEMTVGAIDGFQAS